MVHCKISLGGALRRFSVPDGVSDDTSDQTLTLARLRAALVALHPSAGDEGTLSFMDDEGDVCALLSDADVREAVTVSPKLLRLRFEPAAAVAPPAAAAKAVGIVAKGGGGGGAVAARVMQGGAGHPMPLFKAVAPRATGEMYKKALAKVKAAAPLKEEGKTGPPVGRRVCMMVMRFVAAEKAARGEVAAVAAIPEEKYATLIARVNAHLANEGVSDDRCDLVKNLLIEAGNDAGVRAALFELNTTDWVINPEGKGKGKMMGRAGMKVDGKGDASMPPLVYIVKAAQTPKAHSAINKTRKMLRETDGARKLLGGVRAVIRKTSVRFVRQKIGKGPGYSLKNEAAAAEFGAEIKEIVTDAGLSTESADIVENVVIAMAEDTAAREAAVRINEKQINKHQKRVAMMAAKEGEIVNATGQEDVDVAVAMKGVAFASIADDLQQAAMSYIDDNAPKA